MVTTCSFESFQPRDGQKLRVIRVTRDSADTHRPRSLDNQRTKIQRYVKSRYSGEVEFIDISSKGRSGFLVRDEFLELERQIQSGLVDLVVCEDLSRISRSPQVYDVCEMCINHRTRLVALCDHIDVMTRQDLVRAVFVNECYGRKRICGRRDPKSQ